MNNYLTPPDKNSYYSNLAYNANGFLLNLNQHNPYIITNRGTHLITRAVSVLSVNQRERIYAFNTGQCAFSNDALQYLEDVDYSNYYIGRENILTQTGEATDEQVGIYFQNGVGLLDIFSPDSPYNAYGFVNLYAETQNFAIAATISHDASGNPILLWHTTSNRVFMDILYNYCSSTAAILARYKNLEGKLIYDENDKEGGQNQTV